MLKVRTSVKQSSIEGAGLGLFAEQDIEKGACVWTFDERYDRFFKHEPNFATLAEQNFWDTYAYRDKHSGCWELVMDNDRFINHSDNPNLDTATVPGSSIALRDIKAGEELTEDYLSFTNYDDLSDHEKAFIKRRT